MQKSIPYLIVAILFTVLGFSFAKFCPIGIKLGPAKAEASSPTAAPGDPRAISALITDIQTARAQIELYKLMHDDNWPEFSKYGWKQLTYKTNARGQISEHGKELANATFGPYLKSPPTNPLTKSSDVLVVPSIPKDFKSTGTYGFVFAEDTGNFRALTAEGKIFDDVTASAR